MCDSFIKNLKKNVVMFKLGIRGGVAVQREQLNIVAEFLSEENVDSVISIVETAITDPETVKLALRLKTQFQEATERMSKVISEFEQAINEEQKRQDEKEMAEITRDFTELESQRNTFLDEDTEKLSLTKDQLDPYGFVHCSKASHNPT